MSKRKLDAKAFAQQKRTRRQWITFLRMCRYGVSNFSRNAWLTIAATAVMTITLLVVFVTLAGRNILVDTVSTIRDKVDMSIYVKTATSQADVNTITGELKKLKSVRSVSYVSSDDAQKAFAETNKQNVGILDALNVATNQFPGTFHIVVGDINNTKELQQFVVNDATLKTDIDTNRAPSFAGDSKVTIEKIGSWIDLAGKAGIGASIVFIAISSLIVFNTIRMAIFNRKDEIQMMKLIGADRNFIRGPFVVEAIVYGAIAAVIATGIGIAILYVAADSLLSYGVSTTGTVNFITTYIYLVLIAMIALGGLIGIISSLLATRRYLKI